MQARRRPPAHLFARIALRAGLAFAVAAVPGAGMAQAPPIGEDERAIWAAAARYAYAQATVWEDVPRSRLVVASAERPRLAGMAQGWGLGEHVLRGWQSRDPAIDSIMALDFARRLAAPFELPPLDVPADMLVLPSGEIGELTQRTDWRAFRERFPDARGMLRLSRPGIHPDFAQAVVVVAARGGPLTFESGPMYLEKANGLWRVTTWRITARSSEPPDTVTAAEYQVYADVLRQLFTGEEAWGGPPSRQPRTPIGRFVLEPRKPNPHALGRLDSTLLAADGIHPSAAAALRDRSVARFTLEPRVPGAPPQVIVSELAADSLGLEERWADFYARFPDAPGLVGLSRVGFSSDGRQALVGISAARGFLRGYFGIVYLERSEDGWIIRGWPGGRGVS